MNCNAIFSSVTSADARGTWLKVVDETDRVNLVLSYWESTGNHSVISWFVRSAAAALYCLRSVTSFTRDADAV